MKWSREYNKCKNCSTIRFKHKARGYCEKCYPNVKRIEKVKKWKYTNIPESIKLGLPNDSRLWKKETFLKIKNGNIEQLKDRLQEIKNREQKLNQDIIGLDIETQLNRIANQYKRAIEKDIFKNVSSVFNNNFDNKQRKIIFECLNRIEENIRWSGIDYNKIFLG